MPERKGHASFFSRRNRGGAEGEGLNADQIQAELAQLRRAVDELSTLNELAREIGASLDSGVVIDRILKRSVRAVKAEQATITLVDRAEMSRGKTLVRVNRSSGGHEHYHLDQSLLGWMLLNKQPLNLDDPRADSRFGGFAETSQLRNLICVPLMIKAEVIGVLSAFNKARGETFSQEDLRLLAIIATQSAQVIENARLYEEEKELQKIHEDLRMARRIQLGLLPAVAPVVPGYEIAGTSLPARDVGGDFFDYIETGDGRVAFCLGDVSGKGLPASLLMANLQATIRGQTGAEVGARRCVERTNVLLHRSTDSEKFATLFYAILDPRDHALHYCIAGQEPPLLFTAGGETPQKLHAGGTVLGAFAEAAYEEETATLMPGDFLVVYSDGVTDAENDREEAFGRDRLVDLLRRSAGLGAQDLVAMVVQAVSQHAGERPQFDDVTVLVLRRSVEG
ncbi:MAG: PP2C family protein-serine/threonine phosphatase [Planctomycetes bacterium]|nr:PP2C family protein-serine/threonine phosphatase [Planctomycetota bacterium]